MGDLFCLVGHWILVILVIVFMLIGETAAAVWSFVWAVLSSDRSL